MTHRRSTKKIPVKTNVLSNKYKRKVIIINEEQIKELILRIRRQILVNSCIYYRFGKAVITDKQFDKWAYELADLQKKYPDLAVECGCFNEEFKDWTGESGYQLPLWGNWVERKAQQILDYAEEKGLLL